MTRAARWGGIAALGVTLLVAMWMLFEEDHASDSSRPTADAAASDTAPLPDASSRPATVAGSADSGPIEVADGHSIPSAASGARESAAGLAHVSGFARNDLDQPL